MKQILNNTLLYAATAVLLLAGCSREPLETPEDGRIGGEFVSVTLPVQVAVPELASVAAQAAQDLPAMASADTRAADPGEQFSVSFGATTATAETAPADWTEAAPATRAGTSLSNVWVLQFNAAGQNVSTNYIGTLAAGAYLTVPSLQVGLGYTICVVANGVASGLTTSNPATLSGFETTMLHKDAVTAAANLPMSGKLTDVTVVNLGSGKGKISVKQNLPVVVVMSRILAEVILTVDFGVTGYTLTGAQLYNVPTGATYGWNSATTTFPANTVAANFGYTNASATGMTPLTTTTAGTKTGYKWFIGDNRRGEVAGLTDQTDRNKSNAPAYATFARITLTHSRYVTQKLFYDIYLGSGVMTNFDVKRNRAYAQTATIKGTAEAHEALFGNDPRVSSKGVPIWLTDSKIDSPFLISSKDMQATQPIIWGPTAPIPAAQDIHDGKKCTDAIMAMSAAAYPAARYCRDQGANYYLPSQAELMLMGIYNAAIPSTDRPADGDFWSSTEYSSYTSYAWYVNFSNGITSNGDKGGRGYVRCVREAGTTTWKYPKVESGNTIVSRDAAGGIKSDALLTAAQKSFLINQSTQPSCNEKSEYNKVSAKFQVASADASALSTWTDAYAKCKSYSESGAAAGLWRVPTQRELMLIWMFKPKLTSCGSITSSASGAFWSGTEHSSYPSGAWYVNFSNGFTGYTDRGASGVVRCVRDL